MIQPDDIAPGTIAVLPPEKETRRLRRGKALHNRTILQYAQVALKGRSFHGAYTLPSTHERPFLLYGDISDQALISLYDYLCAHEVTKERNTKEYVISISTKHQKQGDLQDTIEVTTERGAMGKTLYLKRVTFGWRVVSFSSWVS
jgi:hypothetical protein